MTARPLAVARSQVEPRVAGIGRRVLEPLYRGEGVECPCCGGEFKSFRRFRGREGARCPRCALLERHRVLWDYLRERTDLLDGEESDVLHFAPEFELERRLRDRMGSRYVSADLVPRSAKTVEMDITDIPSPDESFDYVLCADVMEHVPDDAKALRELYRVLRPGGRALIMTPVDAKRATTYEDATVTGKRERLREFGQKDHVRIYGRDVEDRLRGPGFELTVAVLADELDPELVKRHALTNRPVYDCLKR